MREITVEISPGELVDRTTILRLKSARIVDPRKLTLVRAELWRHEALVGELLARGPAGALAPLVERLLAINGRLWEIEDDIRGCERSQDFGPTFVALARAVYQTNDERFAVKRAIDQLLGAAITEVKSYASSDVP